MRMIVITSYSIHYTKLYDTLFSDKGKSLWYNVVDDEVVDYSSEGTVTLNLAGWGAKVFKLDFRIIEEEKVNVTFRVSNLSPKRISSRTK